MVVMPSRKCKLFVVMFQIQCAYRGIVASFTFDDHGLSCRAFQVEAGLRTFLSEARDPNETGYTERFAAPSDAFAREAHEFRTDTVETLRPEVRKPVKTEGNVHHASLTP